MPIIYMTGTKARNGASKGVLREIGYCPFDLSPMAQLSMSAECSIRNGLCSTGLSSKQGRPASRPIAADDGSLRAATISAIGLILKPATLMSKTAKSNTEVCANGSAVSMLPASALLDARAPRASRRSSSGSGPRPRPKIWTPPFLSVPQLFGLPTIKSWDTAVTSWAGAKGFTTKMLRGRPNREQRHPSCNITGNSGSACRACFATFKAGFLRGFLDHALNQNVVLDDKDHR
jgi:hypothetical protein